MRHGKPKLFPPRNIDWKMSSVDSAEISTTSLADGRLELLINHAVLSDVTPAILVWWFKTVSESMQWQGRMIPRYHV